MTLGELQAEALGTSGAVELFVLPHPLAGIDDEELEQRIAVAADAVCGWLAQLEQEGAWRQI